MYLIGQSIPEIVTDDVFIIPKGGYGVYIFVREKDPTYEFGVIEFSLKLSIEDIDRHKNGDEIFLKYLLTHTRDYRLKQEENWKPFDPRLFNERINTFDFSKSCDDDDYDDLPYDNNVMLIVHENNIIKYKHCFDMVAGMVLGLSLALQSKFDENRYCHWFNSEEVRPQSITYIPNSIIRKEANS